MRLLLQVYIIMFEPERNIKSTARNPTRPRQPQRRSQGRDRSGSGRSPETTDQTMSESLRSTNPLHCATTLENATPEGMVLVAETLLESPAESPLEKEMDQEHQLETLSENEPLNENEDEKLESPSKSEKCQD